MVTERLAEREKLGSTGFGAESRFRTASSTD
jgi:hypothetical protein